MEPGAFVMVGTTRFELATSRTPSDLGRFVYLFKTAQNVLKSTTYTNMTFALIGLDSQRCNQPATKSQIKISDSH